MTLRAVAIAVCAVLSGASAGTGEPAPASMRGDVLHRMTLLRAAPGRLLDLVAAVKGHGLVLRHSQGDQWDLMVLMPLAGYAELGRAAPGAEPGLVAWQEDELVRGPDLAKLDGFATAGLYHIEMFVALAGRRDELLREREMENAYLAAFGRPRNAIFVREFGGAGDAFTIGAYRSWKHFAERDDIPPDRSTAAARAAGFDGDDRIGPYLRSLIQTHHDTLATPVR
ncbi:MAG: hypothetical protein DMF82_17560 [Acidobacteria bacterium]|nr:MAG: hypothetical protein DMF82_17560 [Acidobacteriota bacterium]